MEPEDLLVQDGLAYDEAIAISEAIAAAQRWWDAWRKGDAYWPVDDLGGALDKLDRIGF